MTETGTQTGDTAAQEVELRRLRKELSRATAQLERLQRRKSSLLAMAAHDLRTPLAIIQGYSHLLAADLAPDAGADVREYITNIVAHAESLGFMVDNLIALDTLERGALRLSLQHNDLNELVAQALAQVEGLAVMKGLTVEFSPGTEPLWVMVDEEQIGRVLYNLLSHTTKYARPESALRVDAVRQDDTCEILFLDPNRHLSQEVLSRLFDLVELGRDGKASLQGMDMGLVVARQVAEAHGGRLEATCVVGQGATLALYLPVAGD